MAGMRHRRNSFHRMADLVIPVPNQIEFGRGLHTMLVDSLGHLGRHPGEGKPKQHLDGKTIGSSIEIEEREPVNGFAQTERREYHAQPNESKRKTVKRPEFQRWLNVASILRGCHISPKGFDDSPSIVLQPWVFVDTKRGGKLFIWNIRTVTRYNWQMHDYRLVRSGAAVQVFVDGTPTVTVDANRRDEMRNYMASVGLTPDEINQKVHELYITNTTKFSCSR
jgi:hypothetical protein